MTNLEQKAVLEKYIDCISRLIGKAIRERRPYMEIAAMQMDSNMAVLKLESIEYQMQKENQRGN
jgi:hypothetical protein